MPRPKRKPITENGRPLKKIDWKEVDEMLKYHMTGTQIAAYFGMHQDTFYDRVIREKGIGFSAYQQEKQSFGKKLILEAQFVKATKNLDSALLIHLGKHLCDQDEKEDKNAQKEERGAVRETAELMREVRATFKSDEIDASDNQSIEINNSIQSETDNLI